MWGLGQALLIGPSSEPQQGQPLQAPRGAYVADRGSFELQQDQPRRPV